MQPVLAPILFLLGLAQTVICNVEKTIFVGPARMPIPLTQPTLESLKLDTLNPGDASSLRTRLTAKFLTESHPSGYATWLLLDHLKEGQRYEVRICWPATQPTSFTLRTYELSTVWETPALITSLRNYSVTRQSDESGLKPHSHGSKPGETERHASVLFLEILAAADYFTTNTTLMQHPQPIDADIILDPFLFNVLPRSLLPTVGVVIVVAIVSFLLSQWVVTQLGRIVAVDEKMQLKKQQ